ncbi:Ctr copper transporter [Talaromyces proteolyticus]|uniref:Copper transport protein n=1 Tax=Talaromyces proteolyticus TaxID=1131652 RepID=A0AAD4KXL8_9EURO|nr:Ctr copper transporter [Talaromyces proteolyticus]KAH8702399.1 Ctr copper transporter [Talaromyces proteolyticus]
MDMDMDHMHQPPSDSSATSKSSGAMAMGMSSIFTSETRITLLFVGWEVETLRAYILTLVFIFMLAILNRFLGALRFQLEKKWTQSLARKGDQSLTPLSITQRRYADNLRQKERLSPLPKYRTLRNEHKMQDGLSDLGPLNFHRDTDDNYDECEDNHLPEDNQRRASRVALWLINVTTYLPSLNWTPSATWSWKRDGARSVLECCRALIGYILMLLVMTFNVGIFCAVIAGVLIGEFILGRYSQASSGWQEGGCHDG